MECHATGVHRSWRNLKKVHRGITESCVHEPYWKDAGADFLTMCDVVNEWIAGFGEGINPCIEYKREKALATGDPSCLSVFKIKS